MNKKYTLFVLTLGLVIMLLGCSKKEDPKVIIPVIEEEIPGEKEDTQESEEVNTEEELQEEVIEDLPPEEGMVRSRITNEWVDKEQDETRPVAVMIPNTSTASQYGLSKASVLYECNVEGTITRLMAIFDDWKDCNRIGNIRSCRDYYVYWAFEWDAIYIHYGGPFYIDDVIGRDDTQNINCLSEEEATYRDKAKNSTDNAFTDSERILKIMKKEGYPLEYREGYADERHYKFTAFPNENTLEQYKNSVEATKIDMSDCYPVTNCYFLYNDANKSYDRYQKLSGSSEGPHIDLENNEQLTFENVIVQNTYHEVRDQKGYLAFQVHDTKRDGWYFTRGRGIHITWEKVSDYGATRYYDDEGNEIEFNTGKTMVLIVEDGDVFKVNNKVVD